MEYSWFLSSLRTVGSISESEGEERGRRSGRTCARAGSAVGRWVSAGSEVSIPCRRTGLYLLRVISVVGGWGWMQKISAPFHHCVSP
jgi:hypothetical protein